MIKIRKANLNDLIQQLSIFSYARKFMKANGNPTQWGDNWPSEEIIRDDIAKGNSYVVTDNDEVVATFAYIIGVDKTYLKIDNGAWLSNKPYGTVHRLASNGKIKGIFPLIMEYIKKDKINIRVDTHKDNKFMIHQLEKCGFKYCGIIYPIEGGERNAYELVL